MARSGLYFNLAVRGNTGSSGKFGSGIGLFSVSPRLIGCLSELTALADPHLLIV